MQNDAIGGAVRLFASFWLLLAHAVLLGDCVSFSRCCYHGAYCFRVVCQEDAAAERKHGNEASARTRRLVLVPASATFHTCKSACYQYGCAVVTVATNVESESHVLSLGGGRCFPERHTSLGAAACIKFHMNRSETHALTHTLTHLLGIANYTA